MDVSQKQARIDATAMVARNFEPVRIERQLLTRAFELVCRIDFRTSQSEQRKLNREIVDQPSPDSIAGRPAA